YRTSRFKTVDAGRFIIAGVTFRLSRTKPTVTYPDVVKALDQGRIANPMPHDIRRIVLAIRRTKGMVLDAADADTHSVGSFFMNPVLTGSSFAGLASIAGDGNVPSYPTNDGGRKVPAAWLIDHSGFCKGHVSGRTGLSSKHPLAIVNRGGATAREIIDF